MSEREDGLYEVPEGWEWVKMGETNDIITGTTPPKSNLDYYGDDYPFFKPNDLNQGFFVYNSNDGLTKEGIKHARLLPPKSVLVTCIGATIGKTGIIRLAGVSNQQINAILPTEYILPEYQYFGIVSTFFQKQIVAKASATTLPIINKTKFENLIFPLPPFNEQHRIVAKIEELFTRLDAGVAALEKAQKQLKQYRQAVLKAAFEGRLTARWREEHRAELEPAAVLLEKIRQERKQALGKQYKELPPVDTSELPGLPEGWEYEKIGHATECLDRMRVPINKKERLKRHGDIPYYGANGQVGWIDEWLFDEPLVLVVEDETFTGRQIPFSYKIKGKTWVNNHAHVLRPTNAIDIDFLNYQLFYYPFTKLTTGTTGRKKLTQNALINAPISLPPLPEQHQIVAQIEYLFSRADYLEQTITTSLARAAQLRQAILKKAFEGRLVPQDPNDESASVLLERIKAEKARQAAQTKTTQRKPRSKK